MPDLAVEKKQLSRDEEEIFTGRETILSDEERAVQETRESDGGVLRERSRAERRRRGVGGSREQGGPVATRG